MKLIRRSDGEMGVLTAEFLAIMAVCRLKASVTPAVGSWALRPVLLESGEATIGLRALRWWDQ
jgi:hypothetical protein